MDKLKEFFKGDHFAALAGIELMEVREGYGKARMLITPDHLNGGGFCQGGAIFTLADLAFAAAVNSHGVMTVSTSSSITFVRSVAKGYVYAEATEIVDHRKLPFAEVRVTDENGNLIAIFTSSGYRKEGKGLTSMP
jgi:acyl-CoA thioesterase